MSHRTFRTFRNRITCAVAGVMAANLAGPVASGQCAAEVAYATGPNCGSPWGLTFTQGQGINSLGEAVGKYEKCPFDDDYSIAIRWTEETGLVPLTGFPAGILSSEAYDINDSGQITGIYYDPPEPGGEIGFLIEADTFTSLGTLPGGNFSAPAAINVAGDIVGTAGNFIVGPVEAFVWSNGAMQTLDGLPEGTSGARDINDRGQIVGQYYEGAPLSRAFLWEDGNFTDLGVIPGGISANATAINNHGHIVGIGVIELPGGETISRPFLWVDGEMMVIELPAYITSCGARDINDAGQVLLSCEYLWQDGVLFNLQDLVAPDMEIANLWEITNDGTMVGRMSVPVDEPGDPDGVANAFTVLTLPTIPAGDLTDDCCTDAADLAVLLGNWGPCVPPSTDPTQTRVPVVAAKCPADLDDDGVVGPADLAIILGNWGVCE